MATPPTLPRMLRSLRPALQIVFVLAPLGIICKLAGQNRYNTLLLDDWAYVPLYQKAVEGGLTMHDFFGGYLEHRIAVARAIAIATTLLTKGDMRAQPAVALVAVWAAWVLCGLLLRRALGPWCRWWIAWGVIGWLIFCPVQWQEFLWPSCHMDTLPLLFLAASLLVLGRESLGFWPRFALCVVFTWLATYSFAAGLTLHVLVPVAAACGLGLPLAADRRRFCLAWLVPSLVILFAYFHGLKNEVEGPFAYGQGRVETMPHSVEAVVRHPEKGLKFLLVLLGSNFARGVIGERTDVALAFGIGSVLVLGTALALLILSWSRRRLRIAALPFAIIALYGVAVAGMISAGRAWASKDVGGALNNRYACFAAAFLAGLTGLVTVLGTGDSLEAGPPEESRRDPAKGPVTLALSAGLARATPVLGGATLGLLIANWHYGAGMMRAWHYARTRGAADIHFSAIFGLSQDRGGPPQHIHLARERAAIMDDLGFLDPPLARNAALSQFGVGPDLPSRQAQIDSTNRRPDNTIIISGFALLTLHGQPADAILFTFDTSEKGGPQIAQVVIPDNPPAFWQTSTSKDLQHVVSNDDRPRLFGRFSGTLDRKTLPHGKVKVQVWALDMAGMTVREVAKGFYIQN